MSMYRAGASILMALSLGSALFVSPSAQAAPSAPQRTGVASAVSAAQAKITSVTLSDTSIDGPALWTTTNGSVRGALAWAGTDPEHHLNVMLTAIGTTFSSKVILDETSNMRPAVTRTTNGKVAIAWTGTDANHTLNVLYDVYGARTKLTLWGETSGYSPALVAVGNTLTLAWTGTNSGRSLNLQVINTGTTLTRGAKTTLWATSGRAGPSLSYEASRSEYLLAWPAMTPAYQITIATSTTGQTWATPTALTATSYYTPSILGIVGNYYNMPPRYVAWTAPSATPSLVFQYTRSFPSWPDPANTRVTLNETAYRAPALGFISGPGLLLTAWTGTDPLHHLNVAVVTALAPAPCSLPGVSAVTPKVITAGTSGRKEVALTFDAGGAEGQPNALLDTLKAKNVPATFFFTAAWAQSHQAVVNRVKSAGYVIGNHTVDHADLVTPARSDSFICYELGLANQIIADRAGISGTRPYFRPPNGSYNTQVVNRAAGIGYYTVMWSIDTIDWDNATTATDIYNRVARNLGPGKIILMHVGSLHEPEALPRVIDYIKSQGYSIVTLNQLLAP
ncbi:MAG: polysaccharide deacetylase family protein [Chloroflexota bacterium]|nr:polysaccharide deacetylase family protein [Chloroflexota bacterium]